MPNLIQSVGRDFFNRRILGSFFYAEDGTPAIVGESIRDTVQATLLKGSVDRLTLQEVQIPNDYFTDMSVFAVPTLGWRAAKDGQFLAYMSRNNRSYHRGLSDANLVVSQSKMTNWLRNSGNFSGLGSTKKHALLAMKPKFVPFTEGIAAIRAGDILSFAASPIVAVMPDEDDKLAIYFRNNKAGEVAPDGTITLAVPSIATYLGEL